MSAPAIAKGPTPSPTTLQTALSTPTSAALAQAKKNDKRVEIEALRSETGTYFANPDGKTIRAELNSSPIRVKKDGAWQPIDTRLIEKDGVLRPKSSLGDLTLSAGGNIDAVTYTGAQGKAAIAAPDRLPEPVVKNNIATYPDAYGRGTDLVVTVTPSGFRHDVVIRQRPAEDLKLRVPMRLPDGLKLGKGPDKTPGVLNAKGKEVDDLSAAPMLDAAAMVSPDQGHISQANTTIDGDSVILTAKADFLTDPAVTYPVTVTAASEEWEGTGIAGDTHVSNVLPNGDDNALLESLTAGRSHSGTRTHRAYIRFNIHDTPLMGATITNADLRLHNYNSHTCSDDNPGIVAHRITDPWTVNTLTWNNQPDITVNGQVGNQGAYSATIPCPEGEGELYYSIEDMVREWVAGEPDEGVRLTSPTETVAQNWRSYRSDEYGGYDTYPFTPRGPVLFIEYEPAPVETVEVGTFQYGHWGATPADLAAQQARQTEVEIPPFTNPTDEEARQAALHSPIRSQVDANELEPPPGLTEEELEEFGESEGGGYEDVPDESDPAPDTVAPQVLTNPADGDTNVPTDTEIRVAFGESVTGQTFVLKDSAATDVSFSVTPIGDDPETEEIEPSDQGWILKPEHSLKGAERYRIEVRAARDAAGNVMTDYAATFTTAGGATPVAGLVAAYGMNEGSGTSVADSSGQNNPGMGDSTAWANGKYGKALSFNGSSSMVTVAHAASLRLTTGMTLSAWVNPTTVTGTPWKSVVTKELNADGASYALYAANGGAVPSGWVQTDPATDSTADGTSPLPVNNWSHLALTYDGATLRLFVNGQQVDQSTLNGSLYDDGSPLRIGGNVVWQEYFRGLIDEVRIYNRAQTATEIQTDMNTPIGEVAPPDTQAPTAPGSLTGTGGPGSAQLTWTASTDYVGVTGYTIHRSTTPEFTPSAANQIGSSPTTTFTDAGLAAGTYYYQVRAADAAGNLSPSSNEISVTVTAPPTVPGLVAAYGMNEGSGTTVGDSSGQNNTGAATDTTWTTGGKHGKALSFNGTTSWVTVPHAESLRLTNALTLSAWVRPATVDGMDTVLMKESADGGPYALYSSFEGSYPLGWLQTADGPRGVEGGTTLTLNQWSHLALTYDGSMATLYVNGTQVDQAQVSGDLVDDGGELHIGGNNFWGDEFYDGLIDEVRIYNVVQTAAQIQADMNTPVGAAAAGVTARRLSTSSAPEIQKLVIGDSRTADGVTVTYSLTPHLTTWLTIGRNGEAKVEVEIAGKPTKSFKAGKVITDRRLIWSGQATAKPNDSQVTLQVPKGLLRDGEKVRWRARAGDKGAWSPWAGLVVDLEQGATGDKTSNDPRGIAPTPAAAIADDDSRVQECWRHEQQARTGATDGTDGYYMNRNTWCAIQEVARGDAQIGSRPGVFVNGITADATIIGTAGGNGEGTPTKDRFSRYRISLKNVTAIGGVYNRQAMIGFGASTYNTACKIAGDSYVQGLWQQWRDGKVVEFTVVSDEANGRGIDKIERCFPKFYAKIWLDGISSTPPKTYWSDAKPEARCDSAFYLTRHYGSGCIFDKVAAVYETTETRPGLPWSDMGDPDNVNMAYRSVASHIWTAQHKKDLTLPKRIDKSIPGHWLSASGPLSRNVNADWRKKNNTKSRNMCRLLFKDYDRRDAELGKGEKHKVYECDEFPFQSTMQGTWVSVERVNSPDAYAYSIRPVWWKRNTEDGIRLGAFYGSQRILGEDGTRRKITYDHFWVEAYVPGQNPH